MASPTDFYSEQFAVEKFGPGLEKVKIKVRISQVYTKETTEDMQFYLKILVIKELVKMIPLRDLIMPFFLFVGVCEELIGRIPVIMAHPILPEDMSMKIILPVAAVTEMAARLTKTKKKC